LDHFILPFFLDSHSQLFFLETPLGWVSVFFLPLGFLVNTNQSLWFQALAMAAAEAERLQTQLLNQEAER
jgi:hypothetical protein